MRRCIAGPGCAFGLLADLQCPVLPSYYHTAIVRLFWCSGNRRSDLRLESGRKSRWMNLFSVYLRRRGCLYMYTEPTLLPEAAWSPEATLTPGTCPAELYERTSIRACE